jgi:hypothetical protein
LATFVSFLLEAFKNQKKKSKEKGFKSLKEYLYNIIQVIPMS